ncbi:MAG: sugar phosphate isomerase/epimerase [Clostridiales bacterium]|nr:sugar phosphate isomerase/epimerase [Clostridiales bacterium]
MSKKNVKIGHTAITWKNEDIADAVKYLAELGFCGIEAFGSLIEKMAEDGTAELARELNLPIISAYCSLDIVNPDAWNESREKIERWSEVLSSVGCKTVVLGGNSVLRRSFNFHLHKDHIIKTINEAGRLFTEKGLLCCFHPHTGTPVEAEEEIRLAVEAFDEKYVAFAPDIGQIQKGGSDALQIVKDYYPLIRHMHFKDYVGGITEYDACGQEIDITGYLGYTPLGRGVVDLSGVLAYLEEKDFSGYVMVELDGKQYGKAEYTLCDVHQSVLENKRYLESLGYEFKGSRF